MRLRQTSRRTFLRDVRVMAAVAPLAMSSGFGSEAVGQDEESYWRLIRWQFSFREDKVPMNAANLCPSPVSIAERVTELTRDIDIDCSFNNRAKFTGLLEASRRKVAEHLGVSADEIALVRNTSEANNVINNGLNLRPGDEVILWDQNHPTNNVAWDLRAARFGFRISRVTTPRDPKGVDELVGVFENAFSPNTRVLAITEVSNISGLRLPVRELCQASARRGIYVHVDGAQSWGALNVNLRELGCDSYSGSSHKWFMGPKEVGVLYVRAERVPEIWPNNVAPGWGDDLEPDVKGARKFESLGQRDDACLAAVGDGVDFHQMMGPSRVERRVLELANTLKAGLKELGAKLVTPEDPNLSAGVCVVEVPEDQRRQLADLLYQEHGIAGAETGGLRLCPHIYNTREHVERALAGVRSLRRFLPTTA
jgi:selenocysteine lyase/cysteine desulfurase